MPRKTKREQVRSGINSYALWAALAERDMRNANCESELSKANACAHVSAYRWHEFEVSKSLRQDAARRLVALGALESDDIY